MTRDQARFVDLAWRKATQSGAGGCVIAAPYQGGVALSDSKTPDAAVLVYTPVEWDAFLDGVKQGEFDRLVGP